MEEQLERIEAALRRIESRPALLVEALRTISRDGHVFGARPCSTCATVTAVMGEPFGCDAYRARKSSAGAQP